MNTTETIASWKWRIKRVDMTLKDFAKYIGISPSLLSDYCNFKKSPSLFRFQMIEDTIKEFEA